MVLKSRSPGGGKEVALVAEQGEEVLRVKVGALRAEGADDVGVGPQSGVGVDGEKGVLMVVNNCLGLSPPGVPDAGRGTRLGSVKGDGLENAHRRADDDSETAGIREEGHDVGRSCVHLLAVALSERQLPANPTRAPQGSVRPLLRIYAVVQW